MGEGWNDFQLTGGTLPGGGRVGEIVRGCLCVTLFLQSCFFSAREHRRCHPRGQQHLYSHRVFRFRAYLVELCTHPIDFLSSVVMPPVSLGVSWNPPPPPPARPKFAVEDVKQTLSPVTLERLLDLAYKGGSPFAVVYMVRREPVVLSCLTVAGCF